MNTWKLYEYEYGDFSFHRQNGGLSEGCCCFVIHYTDVSKYSVDWNYRDEANGLHFLRSDFAL